MEASCRQMGSLHRIVAMEDSETDVVLLRQAFDELKEEYVLDILPDGAAASQFMREFRATSSADPCLIILDLHVPKNDGLTILGEIRANNELANVPVAVVTTVASPSEKARVLESGVSLYRTKPIGWDDTLKLARELFELCRHARKAVGQSS